jgi:hypothetical protein
MPSQKEADGSLTTRAANGTTPALG